MLKNPIRAAVVAALAASAFTAAGFTPATAETPGSLISVQAEPAGWHGLDRGSSVEYWMTDSAGVQRPASGAMFLPEGDAPVGGWPILAYDHGTSGSGPGCGGQADPESAPFPQQRGSEDRLLKRFVDQGFAVVAPDYLGLGRFDTGPHPYLEVRSEATATIDLVRAARAANPDLSRTWSVLGVSQGGHAALSAAHVQAEYSPELDFRGVAAIDPASDVEKILPFVSPTTPMVPGLSSATTSFIVSILAGLRATDPALDIDSYVTPRGKEIVDAAGSQCLDEIFASTKGVTSADLLARPLAPLRDPLAAYMMLPTSGYDAPILLSMNVADTVVPSPLHAALVAQLAANGVDQQVVLGNGQHGSVSPEQLAAIDGFLARVNVVPTQR
ncbi:alpha/beta fold hydrolase [Nocardia sp. PE-7]|uniref:lipase family protein n=1 Tax=Nocardia sp. PE-7 TaxID=3058426 RepID=UPI0026593CCB|nr:alpha/beta fold hydrolase [Nocardia sp. PE-7]WKG08707.1 alpha/beta fold hydrolase [Nocardia sp. PE-7]